MKFPSLKIQNFLAISNAEISLADRGLVLIQGINHLDSSARSNGSGKSSIADALCWCWFGTTARGATGDDIINNAVGKECFVESTLLDDDGITYTATRYRKHKTGKNSFRITMSDGVTVTDLTKGTDKLTQEVAEKILGCSYDVFKGAIYAGQEQMPDLPAMTDKAIKLLLEEAAGVTMLEEAHKLARERMVVSGAAVSMMEGEINGLEQKLEGYTATIKQLTETSEQWQRTQAEKISQIDASITEQKNALVKEITALKSFDAAAIVNELADCDAKLAGVPANKAKLDELQNEARQLESGNRALAAHLSLLQKDLKKTENELATVDHQVGCPCKACGREITVNEIADARKAVEQKQQATEKAIAELEESLQEHTKQAEAALKAAQDFEASLPDLSDLVERSRELQAKQHAHSLATKDAKARGERIKALEADKKRLSEEQNPHQATIEKVKSSIESLETQIKTKNKLLEEHKLSHAYDQEVVKVYSPSGVRALVMDEITPFLNAQTAKYLGVMSDGNITATWTTLTKNAKGELREKFSIDVENDTGGGNFKLLSGGEKRKVRISTALALQDLVATRAVKPIEIFIGDEIDDAMDDAGLERLTTILEEKAQERGTVLIISHNEIQDFIKNIIVVEKQPDRTTTIKEVAA